VTPCGGSPFVDLVARCTNCNAKDSPTESDGQPLGSHKNSRPAKEDWSYSSVVGMLLYLASNSRPDISFAVHQCARFTHNPREIHQKALLRICRYLKGTIHDGLIYEPSEEINVDCYCDADFAALHGIEASDDPNSAKSRTGFVITVLQIAGSYGCPSYKLRFL
jgi:hypothetical protein